jgi:hypothetical protein
MSTAHSQGGIFFLTSEVKRLLNFDAMNKRHEAEDKAKAYVRSGYRTNRAVMGSIL